MLGEVCIHKRQDTTPGTPIEDIETMKDVGCGSNQRYQPSNTRFLSEEEVKDYVKYIADTCSSHREMRYFGIFVKLNKTKRMKYFEIFCYF